MAIVAVQSKAELHPAFVLSPKEAKAVEKRGFEDGHFVNGPKRRIDAGVKVVEGKLGSVVIYTPRLLAYSRGYANRRNEEDSRVVFVFAPSLMPPRLPSVPKLPIQPRSISFAATFVPPAQGPSRTTAEPKLHFEMAVDGKSYGPLNQPDPTKDVWNSAATSEIVPGAMFPRPSVVVSDELGALATQVGVSFGLFNKDRTPRITSKSREVTFKLVRGTFTLSATYNLAELAQIGRAESK